ncbi:HTH domain-containing protein [Flintibacter porci]|uniref:HTH domain-containing protein n=1 Tax=Flintibacter porci TaxID=3342383 RepID=UPI003CCE1A31
MNRINRVTSILIQLQSKKIIPAKEIAQRFNISLRTVYRDIRTAFCGARRPPVRSPAATLRRSGHP